MTQVLVPLADGFEEIEAVTIADVLRRAGADVVLAGLGGDVVTGAHAVVVQADATLDSVEPAGFDAVVLPGGMPGAERLRDDERVHHALRAIFDRGGWVAAICAAPIVLEAAGLAAGRTLTSYPTFRDAVLSAVYAEERVVVDGRIITSRGPGTALEFALALVAHLIGEEQAERLAAAMLVD